MLPDFDENGDLPVGVYKLTLDEVLEHFGTGSLQRQVVARRLVKIYNLAASTGKLRRLIVFGSFVTAKNAPHDIDVFLVMSDEFKIDECSGDVRRIFDHLITEKKIEASIFWMLESSVAVNEKIFIEGWQNKRDHSKRGIIEVVE